MLDLYKAKEVLKEIINEHGKPGFQNEAQTRFHVIDMLLKQCFCWENHIEVEKHEENNGFTDYELGKPRKLILEAKREGVIFEIPAGLTKTLKISIRSLLEQRGELQKAIEQVQLYCSKRGVPLAVITNGHQFIAFLASRTDGKNIADGDAIVFTSLQHMYDNFADAWNYLSKPGVEENRLFRFLTSGDIKLPKKLSSTLVDYPKIRYPSELQATLKHLSELFIQDVMENPQFEQSFYQECYCESGALSKYSLLSKNILNSRYSAILEASSEQPFIQPIKTKDGYTLDADVLSEAMSRRPIVLLGDVGVGKTSFIKNLRYNSALDIFNASLQIYIDLGSKASLDSELKKFILSEIKEQLFDNYNIDVDESKFVNGVYHGEILRFSKGIWGELKITNPEKYQEKLIEKLEELTENTSKHIKNSIDHISSAQRKQVIICIDNADQRDFTIQQEAFIISQELAKEWKATVFLSVRPQTFYKSKRFGALTAYPHKIFTISPPRVDLVIEKRLKYAAQLARGKQALNLPTVKANSLALFLDTLISSLQKNSNINEFLTNITGGNIRSVIEFVTSFIGSPNVDAEKIIEILEQQGDYRIPLHEFTKQALLGDYSHFNSETSISMNILDVTYPDSKEHFLVPIAISFLYKEGEHLDKDGFCKSTVLVGELQDLGFTEFQIEEALRRSTNKKLIETSLRVTFEEDEESNLIGDMPDSFRVTTIGVYHVKKWLSDFAYLEAMLFDTPILDSNFRDQISLLTDGFAIEKRYERALLFREYLKDCWKQYTNSPTYFDMEDLLSSGEESFQNVLKAVKRI